MLSTVLEAIGVCAIAVGLLVWFGAGPALVFAGVAAVVAGVALAGPVRPAAPVEREVVA